MGTLAVGDVVLIVFPYADFARYKKRPALVIGKAEFNNLILCQITSQAETSKSAISLSDADFTNGGLQLKSYIRPDKLFTIERSVIESRLGTLKKSKMISVHKAIRGLFA